MLADAGGTGSNAPTLSIAGATPAYFTTWRRETDRSRPGRSLTRAMVTISPLTPLIEPLYLIPRRIEIVHEFGTFDAVDPPCSTQLCC